MDNSFERLEQYDLIDGEYLEKVSKKYEPLIGSYLVAFSSLEHELNLAIADILHDDYHGTGYLIIENFSTKNRMDLFKKMYLNLETLKKGRSTKSIKSIAKRLLAVNGFRNRLVHANWLSLSRSGLVRTRITIDGDEGFIKFVNTRILPKDIRLQIREVKALIKEISNYKEILLAF